MSVNVPNYPASVWDGSTPTRANRLVNKAPDFEDWDTLVAEVIKMQQLNGGGIDTETHYAVAMGGPSDFGSDVILDAKYGVAIGAGSEARTTDYANDVGQIAIGYIARSWGEQSVALGAACYAFADRTVALGGSAVAGDGTPWPAIDSSVYKESIALGFGCWAGANNGIVIGTLSSVKAAAGIVIGDRALVNTAHDASIVIGKGAASTAANQLVVGGPSHQITEAYFGRGVTHATPADILFSGTSVAAGETDVAGAAFKVAAGKGTGAGTAAAVVLQSPTPVGSGTTAQVLADRASFDAVNITLGSATGENINLGNSAGKVGFFGETAIVQPNAYTVTNPVDRRSFDTTTVTLAQLAEVVGTIIADQISYGLFK